MFYLSQHVKLRMSQRQISPRDIELTLKNGGKYTMYDGKTKYHYQNVVLIVDNNTIVTAYIVR